MQLIDYLRAVYGKGGLVTIRVMLPELKRVLTGKG